MELRQTQKTIIDGKEYAVTQLGAITGSKVFVRVLKVLGPGFLENKVSRILETIQEEDFLYLCQQFRTMTFVDGQPLEQIFDTHFAGHYQVMLRWLFFCLQVNFGDFLKGKSLGPVEEVLGSKTGP